MKVVESMRLMRRLAFIMVLMMVFLMFKTWDHIPSLRGVSATLVNASSRLYSFGVIVLCLVTLFAGSAMLGFGQQMEEYHTFSNALVTTLIVVATGTEEIHEVQYSIDPLLASLWYVVFAAVAETSEPLNL